MAANWWDPIFVDARAWIFYIYFCYIVILTHDIYSSCKIDRFKKILPSSLIKITCELKKNQWISTSSESHVISLMWLYFDLFDFIITKTNGDDLLFLLRGCNAEVVTSNFERSEQLLLHILLLHSINRWIKWFLGIETWCYQMVNKNFYPPAALSYSVYMPKEHSLIQLKQIPLLWFANPLFSVLLI